MDDLFIDRLERATDEIDHFLVGASNLWTGKIFALIVKDAGMGEEALRRELISKHGGEVYSIPQEELKRHDVQGIKYSLKRQADLNGIAIGEVTDNDLWSTVADIKKHLTVRPLLWLNFTETPTKYWPIWRTGIEENLCSLVLICREVQWLKASSEIPEITDSVVKIIKWNKFLEIADLPSLEKIAGKYVTEALNEDELSKLRKHIEVSIDDLRENGLVKAIWVSTEEVKK